MPSGVAQRVMLRYLTRRHRPTRRRFQDLFRSWNIAILEAKIEHPAPFALLPSQPHPLFRIDRLLDVRNVHAPARDSLLSLDIRHRSVSTNLTLFRRADLDFR